jgi:hypothetical protein
MFAVCGLRTLCLLFVGLFLVWAEAHDGLAQVLSDGSAQLANPLSGRRSETHQLRASRFLGGRASRGKVSAAAAMSLARQQHVTMVQAQEAGSAGPLSASWQAIGPDQIASAAYGDVTGRVTAIAIDPADTTGNTVYVGTTSAVCGSRRMRRAPAAT